jgi:hypothetical protein
MNALPRFALAASAALFIPWAAAAATAALDTAAIESATGLKGTYDPAEKEGLAFDLRNGIPNGHVDGADGHRARARWFGFLTGCSVRQQ